MYNYQEFIERIRQPGCADLAKTIKVPSTAAIGASPIVTRSACSWACCERQGVHQVFVTKFLEVDDCWAHPEHVHEFISGFDDAVRAHDLWQSATEADVIRRSLTIYYYSNCKAGQIITADQFMYSQPIDHSSSRPYPALHPFFLTKTRQACFGDGGFSVPKVAGLGMAAAPMDGSCNSATGVSRLVSLKTKVESALESLEKYVTTRAYSRVFNMSPEDQEVLSRQCRV